MKTLEKFEFLIRLNRDFFLSDLDGHTITGTGVPSAAFHFDYKAADKICAGLRMTGYPQVHVCDVLGQPITADDLREALEPYGK